MTLSGIEEYSLRSIVVLGCNMYIQITEGKKTLPKAVFSTVKMFAVQFPENDSTKIPTWISSLPLFGRTDYQTTKSSFS